MEAVPRLHMLWFSLKSSPEGTNFSSLKKYIAEVYQEDPDSYSKEVQALETLRNQAMHPAKDGSALMKRYYCQLHALQTRFPQISEQRLLIFHWKDLYGNQVQKVHDLRYEMAAVLFNIAATHTQVGASVTRGDADGMKLACTHFQCAAWSFGELREKYANINQGGDFMTSELLTFMQQVSYAQAQECILEKSLIDNRKPNIVAKVTSQIVTYYGAALAALLTGGDDGAVAQVVDSSVYKLWKKYVRFKISYLYCILYLYQGQHSEEQQKMGERVTLYQAAWEKLEEARKESRGLPDQKEINESLVFTADVVEGKRKNAKNENEFIYHEAVPELSDIAAVQGANLVNGISFSVTDPEVMGEDIFARLVPMKAHEASSIYSEKKAQLLRKYGALIEERDNELATFMSSLTLDPLNVNEEKANKIPQGIVDRCASLNSNKTAITELIHAMQQLVEITTDVELNLKDISGMLEAEQQDEQEFQKLTGVQRTSNAHIIELMREYQKYMEAHTRAGESNDTLRKAMELHVNNLKILAQPLSEIQKSVPKLSGESNTSETFKEVKLLLNKVNEMKAQRQQFHAELRIAIAEDDITSKVIAQGIEEGDEQALNELFNREFSKHARLTQLLDQNLSAQKNILVALTDSYAQAAPLIKSVADIKQKRDAFFGSLAASYDVYEDLLAKSAKGVEFYKKLSANVQKLLTRLKSARDVQKEERQQRLNNVNSPLTSTHVYYPPTTTATTSKPKLRDYQKTNSISAIAAKSLVTPGNTPYIPPIRPNPIGSEAPVLNACQAAAFYTGGVTPATGATGSTAPNEPPPPYSFMPETLYYPNMMNAMLQQQQLQQTYNNQPQQLQAHIAPPAYTPQASPNSQFLMMQQNINPQQQQQQPISYLPANSTAQTIQTNNYNNTNNSGKNVYASIPTTSTYSSIPTTVSSLQPLYVVTTSNESTYNLYNNQIYLQQQQQQTQQQQTQQQQTQQQQTGITHMQQQPHQQQSIQGQSSSSLTSATNHPGYTFNPLTGNYEYGSGYHQATNMNTQFYGRYTTSTPPVAPTDSESAKKINVATGFNSPIVSHTTPIIPTTSTSVGHYQDKMGQTNHTVYNYYTPPYGVTAPQQQQQQQMYNMTSSSYYVTNVNPTPKQHVSENQPQQQQYPIYMQSGGQSIAPTQTTKSAAEYASSVAQQKSLETSLPKSTTTTTVTTTATTAAVSKAMTNIDLLTDINFADSEANNVPPPILPTPVIKPTNNKATTQTNEEVQETTTRTVIMNNLCETKDIEKQEQTEATTSVTTGGSNILDDFDKLSISSDLSSLDANFDWDVNKLATPTKNQSPSSSATTTFIMRPCDPFVDAKVLKYFHKEVERYEKMIESLNMKMLNGNTQLSAKWKELLDLQQNDKNNRSTSVAKLFPEKNRSAVSLPYDHARVKLERNTDDYINAAFIKNLGLGCPNIIIAQTPLQNTIADFWSMIWSHRARTIVCLHTPNEMLDPYWPKELNMELHFDDFSIKCIKINTLSHTVEYQLKLSMHNADPIVDLSVVQIKTWSNRLPSQILGIASNALQLHQQHCCNYQTPQSPMVFNCLNGSERSEYLAISVATILATESKRPMLINVVDVWNRICAARQNPLRDQTTLEQFMHIILSHAHDVLNKRGIMTSYQMKLAPQVASEEKCEIKDPLNELDPLWKLK